MCLYLGYKQAKLDKFNDDLNPALALLTDWILTSGNTALSVDVLVTYLEQMKREDIVEAIQAGQGKREVVLLTRMLLRIMQAIQAGQGT